MIFKPLSIPDIILFEPKVFKDHRGFFLESYNQKLFQKATGVPPTFVQDNHSQSNRGVLRGLHYQINPQAQGKLVRVIQGEVFDVAVNLRKSSPSFGKWVGEILSAENKKQLWIPKGFAHGFVTLSDTAELLYKVTDYYNKDFERCIHWKDPQIGIDWKIEEKDISLSEKDSQGTSLSKAEIFP